jgi:hypothetical protein
VPFLKGLAGEMLSNKLSAVALRIRITWKLILAFYLIYVASFFLWG